MNCTCECGVCAQWPRLHDDFYCALPRGHIDQQPSSGPENHPGLFRGRQHELDEVSSTVPRQLPASNLGAQVGSTRAQQPQLYCSLSSLIIACFRGISASIATLCKHEPSHAAVARQPLS